MTAVTVRHTALYRLLASNGRLLYVGISGNPDFRWGTHSNKQPWWHEVADRKIEWFPDRESAAAAEVKAIQEERPLYNKQHSVQATRVAAEGRTLAQRLDAEQRALGRMLLNRAAIDDVNELPASRPFRDPRHQTIYQVLRDLRDWGEPVNPVMVGAELVKRGRLTLVGGASYVHELADTILGDEMDGTEETSA